MTEVEYMEKVKEIEKLLNDPDVPLDPKKVWSLLEELTTRNAFRTMLYDIDDICHGQIDVKSDSKY